LAQVIETKCANTQKFMQMLAASIPLHRHYPEVQMGAFNVLKFRWQSRSGEPVHDLRVQFKYGDTWQHEYVLGDEVRWGGNDIGVRFAKHVVVEGVLENDESTLPQQFEIHIVDGRIASANAVYEVQKKENGYLIVC
jgi:hypothetical protein